MKALMSPLSLQRRAATAAACVLVLSLCLLALFCSSRRTPSIKSEKALAELKECREMLRTRNEEMKNCQLECGSQSTADSPRPEIPLPSDGSSEVFDPAKWQEEILRTLPPRVRREIAPNLDHYFGLVQKSFADLRRENRQIREDARETLRKQDELLNRYKEDADRAPKLEAKDQDLQTCQAEKEKLEEHYREQIRQVEKIKSAVEDIRRFAASNLKCGTPSQGLDGLREAKKKELCTFFQERQKELESIAGN